MLTGKELGDAIESARIAKGVSKKKLADDFGVSPPSVQGWVKYGRIDKGKLFQLIDYFKDDVEDSHWHISDDQARVIYGGAAKNHRLKHGGDAESIFREMVEIAAKQAAEQCAKEDTSEAALEKMNELIAASLKISKHPLKLFTLYVSLAQASMYNALDEEEIDAITTLVTKRRNEKVHGHVFKK